MTACNFASADRRRTFWVTQPDACGSYDGACDTTCGFAGLALTELCEETTKHRCGDTPYLDPTCTVDTNKPRTIVNTNWIRGLALNMLLTKKRRADSACGVRAGAMNGHWTESYMSSGKPVGTDLYYIGAATTVNEIKLMVKAYAEATLQKLIDYKVATSVVVTVKYRGGNNFEIDAEIWTAQGISAHVGLKASKTGTTLNWMQ